MNSTLLLAHTPLPPIPVGQWGKKQDEQEQESSWVKMKTGRSLTELPSWAKHRFKLWKLTSDLLTNSEYEEEKKKNIKNAYGKHLLIHADSFLSALPAPVQRIIQVCRA